MGIAGLLLAGSVWAEEPDCGHSFSLLADRLLQGEQESLPSPKKFKIGAGIYETKKIIGTGSSTVYLTTDGQYVVKIYPYQNEWLANYEYWVTRYLKEKGAPVLDVIGKPQVIEENHQRVVAVVKPYVKGIVGDKIYMVVDSDEFARLFDETVALKAQIDRHFANKQFVSWLEKNGVDLNSVTKGDGAESKLLHHGDVVLRNLLYDGKHWIIIDP